MVYFERGRHSRILVKHFVSYLHQFIVVGPYDTQTIRVSTANRYPDDRMKQSRKYIPHNRYDNTYVSGVFCVYLNAGPCHTQTCTLSVTHTTINSPENNIPRTYVFTFLLNWNASLKTIMESMVCCKRDVCCVCVSPPCEISKCGECWTKLKRMADVVLSWATTVATAGITQPSMPGMYTFNSKSNYFAFLLVSTLSVFVSDGGYTIIISVFKIGRAANFCLIRLVRLCIFILFLRSSILFLLRFFFLPANSQNFLDVWFLRFCSPWTWMENYFRQLKVIL